MLQAVVGILPLGMPLCTAAAGLAPLPVFSFPAEVGPSPDGIDMLRPEARPDARQSFSPVPTSPPAPQLYLFQTEAAGRTEILAFLFCSTHDTPLLFTG
jgi:hypothetical protein